MKQQMQRGKKKSLSKASISIFRILNLNFRGNHPNLACAHLPGIPQETLCVPSFSIGVGVGEGAHPWTISQRTTGPTRRSAGVGAAAGVRDPRAATVAAASPSVWDRADAAGALAGGMRPLGTS